MVHLLTNDSWVLPKTSYGCFFFFFEEHKVSLKKSSDMVIGICFTCFLKFEKVKPYHMVKKMDIDNWWLSENHQTKRNRHYSFHLWLPKVIALYVQQNDLNFSWIRFVLVCAYPIEVRRLPIVGDISLLVLRLSSSPSLGHFSGCGPGRQTRLRVSLICWRWKPIPQLFWLLWTPVAAPHHVAVTWRREATDIWTNDICRVFLLAHVYI